MDNRRRLALFGFNAVKRTLTNVYEVKGWTERLVQRDLIFSPVSRRLENRSALLI